jgi:thiamine-monophosphate kinase
MVADLEALYRGMGDLARRFDVMIAGGDIVRSPRSLAFHVAAIGETRGGRVLTRSGARPGDRIGVSGTLGAAGAGLRLLDLPGHDPRRTAATADLLLAAHVRPEPRVALGAALLTAGATAAMDLSDGLMGDLPKILAASGVSARLDLRRIPVLAAVRALFPDDWLELALRGGEDYELLFTAPAEKWTTLSEAAQRSGDAVTPIGEIVAGNRDEPEIWVLDFDGETRSLAAGAYDHFGAR